jgi:hypothetical protein
VKCNLDYEGDGLRLAFYAAYSWEMALNMALMHHSITVGLDRISDKAGEVKSMKIYRGVQQMASISV